MPADPCVHRIAVLLPVAGLGVRHELDPREPLDRLVAKHVGHVEAYRPTMLTRHRRAQHRVRGDRSGLARLLDREALGIEPVERRELER